MKGLRRLSTIHAARYHGLTETLRLSLVEDALHVRKATIRWVTAATTRGQAQPLLNWVAVFNFNAGIGGDARLFSLHSGGRSEALMLLRIGHVVRCDAAIREKLVYISFLEVAPWNRPDAPARLFSGLGPIMLRLACDLSVQRGFEGRIGLHSVAEAEPFYRRLGFQSFDCPSEYNELYFELSPAEAASLMSD